MALKFLNKGIAKKYQDLAKKLPEVKDRVLREVAEEAKEDFERTVATWNHKPEFEIEDRPRSIAVITDDDVYNMLDKGTKPHTIRPKNGNYLAFQGGFQAKTTPRVIGSRPGGASGDMIYTQEVHHPGTEAREFSKTIYNKWQKEFASRMTDGIKQGVESVGL